MVPSMATNPKGMRETRSAAVTPMSPRGAVSTTMARRGKLCSCSMRVVSITSTITGATTAIERCPLPASSTAPPVSMR